MVLAQPRRFISFFMKLQCGRFVPRLRDEGPQHLALNADVHLVQMPAPVGVMADAFDPALADLGREHRTNAVAPLADGLVEMSVPRSKSRSCTLRSESG